MKIINNTILLIALLNGIIFSQKYYGYENPNDVNLNSEKLKNAKIKSVIKATIYSTNDTMYYKEKSEYDLNGLLVKWKYLDTFVITYPRHGTERDALDSISYFYNNLNQCYKKILHNRGYNVNIKYEYNANNELISETRENEERIEKGIYKTYSLYRFNANGNLISEMHYTDYMKDTSKIVYEYTNKSMLNCKKLHSEGPAELLWEYNYSVNNDTVKEIDHRYDVIITYTYIYKNKLLQKKISNFSGFSNDIRINTNYYNENDILFKRKLQHWGWNKINYYNYPDETWYTKYFYNSLGFIEEEIRYYSNWKPSSKDKFIYEYYE